MQRFDPFFSKAVQRGLFSNELNKTELIGTQNNKKKRSVLPGCCNYDDYK